MVFWESTSIFFVAVTSTYEPLMETHYMSWRLKREVLYLIVMNAAVIVNKEGMFYFVMDAKELFTWVKS